MSLLHDPMHPGEVLKELYLDPLDIGAIGLARRLGVPRTRIERLVKGATSMTPDTALLYPADEADAEAPTTEVTAKLQQALEAQLRLTERLGDWETYVLVAEMLRAPRLALTFGLIGLGLSTALTWPLLEADTSVFGGTYRVDLLSGWAKLTLLPGTALSLLLVRAEIAGRRREGSVQSLVVLVTLGALMQLVSPSNMRGRAVSLHSLAISFTAFGGFVMGVGAGLIGVPIVLAISGGGIFANALGRRRALMRIKERSGAE